MIYKYDIMNENICIEVIDSGIPQNTEETIFNGDTFIAKQLDYQENYIMSDLKKIADYYEISHRKLRKDELIQEIVIYESDPSNAMEYFKRLQAWYWMKELKDDPKLKHYIIF